MSKNIKHDRSHLLWRSKESLDLIGDVLFASEISNDDLESLYNHLCRVLIHSNIPNRLSPGRRAVQGKAIIAEYQKAEKKARISRIRKGDIYA